jgi:hypothetical protein
MIECKYGGCGDFFPLDFAAMQAHLRAHFALNPLPSGTPRFCEWAGCQCAERAKSGNRCSHLQLVHPTHVQDVPQHVWDSHLGLRYVCGRCKRADFTSERSMLRHRNGRACPGPQGAPTVVVFCAHCKLPWQSQADMDLHAPHCMIAMTRSV